MPPAILCSKRLRTALLANTNQTAIKNEQLRDQLGETLIDPSQNYVPKQPAVQRLTTLQSNQ
jgi:hypothetical protein